MNRTCSKNALRLWVWAAMATAWLFACGVGLAAELGPGVDYAGRPFVTQRAPDLKFAVKTAPSDYGIDYEFNEQTARGVALFSRFPEFRLSDRRVHVDGPWYDSAAANGHFTHGITSVGAIPNYRQGPTDIREQDPGRKWALMTDPLWMRYAGILADELAQANPADPRLSSLRLLANDHKLANDEASYRALGKRAWMGERGAKDAQSRGWGYGMIDIECVKGGWEHQRNAFGWLYQGLIEGARESTCEFVPVTYGQWTFNVGAVWESMRQKDSGLPEYLKPEKNCLRDNDPTLQACNDAHGVVSMDGYLQGIWGREPFFKRDRQGGLILKDGKPEWNTVTNTTLYGVQVLLEPNEARKCIEDLYRAGIRLYLMYHYTAGGYPSDITQRLAHLKNIKIGAWSRYTNEGVQGIDQNDRPLPGWEIEMLMGMYLFLADDIVIWSSDFNHKPGPLGGDYTKSWTYNTQGVVEYAIKALHRYSALDPLHPGDFKWCWFSLPVVNKNETDGDRYDQKPMAFGKLRTFQDKPWIEIYVAWPGLDTQTAAFTLHVGKNGKRSPDYRFMLKNGRSYFYDAWQLSEAFADCEGRDVVLEFTDQQGKTRIWRGDWRANEINQTRGSPL